MLRLGKTISVLLLLQFFALKVWAQSCTTLGQTPFTAFPVCGQSNFGQTTVPSCVNGALYASCGGQGISYEDVNPFWYKFTCFSSGTLGFLITPNTITDDYDWQIFDITGHSPGDVYTDRSLFVACSWSGDGGITGASLPTGSVISCGGYGQPLLTKMPDLVAGHNYLLMVSHFTPNSQSGYSLSFNGGTAVITDETPPAVQSAYAVCDGTEIVVKLNKKMRCSSVAQNGSDFVVTGPTAVTVVSASGNGCSAGFDMDSVTLKLGGMLSPGTYTVTAKTGIDGNTLLDICDNLLPVGEQATLRFTPSVPTLMDSITPVVCIKDTLQLVFAKPMKCSSIAEDGSDFTITGPSAVSVKKATGLCTNGVSTSVLIILSSPIRTNGTFQVTLHNGSDGNSLIDECDQVTPAGSVIGFTTKDIVTGDFTLTVGQGCKNDSLAALHDGNNGANRWQWQFDTTSLATASSVTYSSNAFGPHKLFLTVSNGKCTDTSSKTFEFIDQTVKAAFTVSADTACATDTLRFIDQSVGTPVSWQWDWGSGSIVTQQDPGTVTLGATSNRSGNRTILLTVRNGYNCTDVAARNVFVLLNCNIAVPSAFTPNGDGLNDYLYPLNAYKASNMVFRIFHRSGQIIFESRNAGKKWDGRVNGMPEPSGTYIWTLDYTDVTTKKKVSLSGTTVLIR